jgi:hypothetical protein
MRKLPATVYHLTRFNLRDPISQTSTQAAAVEQPTWHRESAAGVPIVAISISLLINCCQCTDRCKFSSQKIHLQRCSAISRVTKEKRERFRAGD